MTTIPSGDLPSGTLTFFFSDIEGSTRLLEALGDRYPPLLERHRALVRAAFAVAGGIEISTQGDSFFAVFREAAPAVEASVAIQRAMAAEPWPAGAPLRIRIGLHTGEARVSAGDYVGLDVHRAARIMSAGHGGQIVASEATRTLARPVLAPGMELRDLGLHRLKDLSAPERLFGVLGDGLADEFPPLRTLDRTPNNLPTQPSALVGRIAELERIGQLLEAGAVRLLTLTGPGGIGKTRLALQAAADHADRVEHGVYFVDLSAVADAEGVLREIARSVGIPVPAGMDLRTALTGELRGRELLLLLDNFEQVMSAADEVADLLRASPRLRIVVTSREALRVRGEQLLPVAPLAIPDAFVPGAAVRAVDIAGCEAVWLFVERAGEANPDFRLTDANAPVVAEICSRLDGLPLAIELAAARLRLFSAEELRDRLRSRLDILRGGARDLPARQRTLRGTIEWSHDLLDQEEQALFALLAAFASARIDAVEEVASRLHWLAEADVVEGLASLVDKSLLRSTADGGGQRLSMLETIREYAIERLETVPERATAAREAHARHYIAFAEASAAHLRSDRRAATLDALAGDLGNLLAAWRHAAERGERRHLTTLLDVLWPLHEARGWYHGALVLIRDLLAVIGAAPAAPDQTEDEITLRISAARGLLAIAGYTEEVERLYREAIALADAAGALPRRLPVMRSLASFHLYRGELDRTVEIGREVLRLAEQEGDPSLLVEGHAILGPSLVFVGQSDEGLAHLDRAIELFDPGRHRPAQFRLGPSPGVAAAAVAGLVCWVLGRFAQAEQRAATAVQLATRLGHPYSTAYAMFHTGLLDLWDGRPDIARSRCDQLLVLAEANAYEIWTAVGTVLRGVTKALLEDPAGGLIDARRGVALYREIPTPPVFWPQLLGLRATAEALAGETAGALATVDEAMAIAPEGSWDSAMIMVQRADLLAASGRADETERQLLVAWDRAGAGGARAIQLMAGTRLAQLSPNGRHHARTLLAPLLAGFAQDHEVPLLRQARAVLEETKADVR